MDGATAKRNQPNIKISDGQSQTRQMQKCMQPAAFQIKAMFLEIAKTSLRSTSCADNIVKSDHGQVDWLPDTKALFRQIAVNQKVGRIDVAGRQVATA